METKSFQSAYKEIDDRTVTGFAAISGNIDSTGDRIKKGAFKKTLKDQGGRIRHLWQHDSYDPPTAVITDLQEVGKGQLPKEIKEKYPEATGGLLVSRKYLDTERGNEILAGLQAGAINEMSFAYDPVKTEFETIEDGKSKGGRLIRVLKEVRLWETSDVNWGMNEATVAVKGLVRFIDTGFDGESEWIEPTLEDYGFGDTITWKGLPPAEKERIAAHYVIGTKDTADFGDLLYPHHTPSLEGVGKANLTGLRVAMDAMYKGDIERESFHDIHDHLAMHFPAGKDYLPFALLELFISLSFAETHVPLSRDMLEFEATGKLLDQLNNLQMHLIKAEPVSVHSLVSSVAQLQIAQSELDLLGVIQ